MKDVKKINEKLKVSLLACLGSFIGIFLLLIAGHSINNPMLIAPFGASCVILFGLPKSPLARPYNLILGHILTSIVGILVFYFLGNSFFSISLGVALGVFLMLITGATHPPAGANPIVVITAGLGIKFLLLKVIPGTIILFIINYIYQNYVLKAKYPS